MRNEDVQRAVDLLIRLVDKLANGEDLGNPTPAAVKRFFDAHVDQHGGSVRLACAYLAAYSVVDSDWNFKSVPTGTRGQYGDKLLASELSFRHVTFHKSITAFGENLGWKER